MGKVTKFTGSKLLGAELRRMRGGRSLKQIAELSKTPPLSERFAPVAAPTLSQVENGISFPSLETLHSLSIIYKRPVQQLLDFAVQDRLVADRQSCRDEGEALSGYRTAFGAADWHLALAMAFDGEGLAATDSVPVWRMRRGLVLQELGMEHDALDLLLDAFEDPDLPAERRAEAQLLVANALGRLGRTQSAVALADAARASVESQSDDVLKRRLIRTRAYLTVLAALSGKDPGETRLRDCLRDLESQAVACEDAAITRRMGIHVAACRWLLGNRLVANRDLKSVLKDSRGESDEGAELESLCLLGFLERRSGQHGVALSFLEEAASLAARLDEPSTAFEASFEAYLAACEVEPARAHQLLKRCTRFHPFVRSRSMNVVLFERVAQEA